MSISGIARIKTGVANEYNAELVSGFSLIVNIESMTPRKSEPASPIYIRAGDLFHIRNPKVPPVKTIDSAAI